MKAGKGLFPTGSLYLLQHENKIRSNYIRTTQLKTTTNNINEWQNIDKELARNYSRQWPILCQIKLNKMRYKLYVRWFKITNINVLEGVHVLNIVLIYFWNVKNSDLFWERIPKLNTIKIKKCFQFVL